MARWQDAKCLFLLEGLFRLMGSPNLLTDRHVMYYWRPPMVRQRACSTEGKMLFELTSLRNPPTALAEAMQDRDWRRVVVAAVRGWLTP